MDEETIRLGKIIQDYNNGNAQYRSRNKERFLEAKNRLVELRIEEIKPFYIKRYKRKIDSETLNQLIFSGALTAAEDYNPKIADFSTHAQHKIKQEISLYLGSGGDRAFHLTQNGYSIWLPLIKEAERVLMQSLTKKINDTEIIGYILEKHPEKDKENVYEAVTAVRTFAGSKSNPKDSRDHLQTNPLELLIKQEELANKKEVLKKLRHILGNGVLDERKKRIIRAHYGIGTKELTLEEIGKQEGITKQRVKQIEVCIIEDIRYAMGCQQYQRE